MKQSMLLKKVTTVLLSLAITVVFMPAFAFADAASDITVFMTVSNAGELAKAKDGSMMAWKEVTVKDLDASGDFSYDEALVAMHKEYNSEDGYDPGSGMVKKVWGVQGGSYLFYINGQGIKNDVKHDTVSDGDYLVTGILSDTSIYSDWFTTFDNEGTVKAKTGEAINLKIKGHLGMAYMPDDLKDSPIKDMSVGYYKDGQFVDTGAKTDAEGNCTISFDKPGTYIVSAKGKVKSATVSVYTIPAGEIDGKKYASRMDWSTYDSFVLYTEKSYGDGPYPQDEIKEIDFSYWSDLSEEEQAAYNLVYINNYVSQYEAYYPALLDAPTIAPACVITVEEKDKTPVKPSTPAPKKVPTVTVKAKTVDAKTVAEAVKKAGGSVDSVTSFVLDKKVKKIKKGTFSQYKNLTTLTVKTKKLKKKSVKGSMKGSSIKTIKVQVGKKKTNKKYVKKYKKIFTKKNAGKKVKVTM